MIKVFSGLFNSGIFQVLLLLLIFAGVALLANFIRKLIWPNSTDSVKVDPKKAVKEELDRVLVPLEEPLKPASKSVTTQIKTKSKTVTLTNPTKKKTKSNAGRRKSKSS
jgi:energy-converting hydrogenase Eha subunit F